MTKIGWAFLFLFGCGPDQWDRQEAKAMRETLRQERRVDRERARVERASRAICEETCDTMGMRRLRYWGGDGGLRCRCLWSDAYGKEVIAVSPRDRVQTPERVRVEALRGGIVGTPSGREGWRFMRDDAGACTYCMKRVGHSSECKILGDVARGYVNVSYGEGVYFE
ncbi:MAG: hypothetical protein ACRD1X_22110 [Vicinamibacteria bacterium]